MYMVQFPMMHWLKLPSSVQTLLSMEHLWCPQSGSKPVRSGFLTLLLFVYLFIYIFFKEEVPTSCPALQIQTQSGLTLSSLSLATVLSEWLSLTCNAWWPAGDAAPLCASPKYNKHILIQFSTSQNIISRSFIALLLISRSWQTLLKWLIGTTACSILCTRR